MEIEKKRRTSALPSIFNSYGPRAEAMPKPTPYNLAAIFGDSGGAAGDQQDQGSDCGNAVEDSAAAGVFAGDDSGWGGAGADSD